MTRGQLFGRREDAQKNVKKGKILRMSVCERTRDQLGERRAEDRPPLRRWELEVRSVGASHRRPLVGWRVDDGEDERQHQRRRDGPGWKRERKQAKRILTYLYKRRAGNGHSAGGLGVAGS